MMRNVFCLLLLKLSLVATAQESPADTAKVLQPVLIQAYASERPLTEIPASIAYVGSEDLQRFNNTSILPAVNAIPGVRMEERSPGSYRFSIRGSLLRSPFGVRNVKVYWNGLPLTDGGGNTYLNLLDFNSIGNMEIIRGPGGSLYGAATGGVVLLNSPLIKQTQLELSSLGGSYGLQRYHISQQFQTKKINLRVQYAHQQSDGYRKQTEMGRHAVNADMVIKLSEKSTLSSTFFYSDLFYQTPGGLTQAQYDADPKQARPAAGTNPGAVEQKATVYNRTPYLGLSYDHEWNDRWSTRVGIFGSQSAFKNPTIRNYEERKEKNAGARTETQYHFGKANRKNKITFGGEYQVFGSPVTVYDNAGGEKGAVQVSDDLSSSLLLFFGQAEFELPAQFFLTVGGSVNFLHYGFTRNEPAPVTSQDKNFDAEFSPRMALLKKVSENFSVYANISRGFSPPSLAEVRPSTNAFNGSLQAERGVNYEAGIRGNAASHKLTYDITLYDFRLRQTIITQRLTDGADYFVNAGKTTQRGIEAVASWNPLQNTGGFISGLKIWNSYAFNRYRFADYVNDGTNYSGNKLTGVPPSVNTSGADLVIKRKGYLNITTSYVDHIPLNDANTVFANEYFLLGGRAGFKTKIGNSHMLDVFAGVDNALDKKYSLGNDLNAAPPGRYFNAASPRNFYAGARFILAH
jgi:iron complex outermembrane recepter protein